MEFSNCLRRIEVIVESIQHSYWNDRCSDLCCLKQTSPFPKNSLTFSKCVFCPIQWLTIVRSYHVEAQHLARPIVQKLADGEEIAERFGHLLAFDLEEAVVHPDLSERMIEMRSLRLRDFVLVMGEDEIDAAAVDVEGFAQQGFAHRRAFDVPAGPSTAPRRIPSG